MLTFGLSSAPSDFSRVVKQDVKLFRKRAIRCSFYIDDLIFLAESREAALQTRSYVLGILHELGFLVSVEKSLLQPRQVLPHLGFELHLRDATLWVPLQKVAAIKAAAHSLIAQHRAGADGRTLARVIGKLGSLRPACLAAQVLARGLMRSLDSLPLRVDPKQARARLHEGFLEWRDFGANVQLSPMAIAELRFWLAGIMRLRCAPLQRALRCIAFTDACPEGLGSVWAQAHSAGGQCSLSVQQLLAGRCLRHANPHSSQFELQAPAYAGSRLHICCDNVGAAYVAGQGCMRNAQLHAMALEFWNVCLACDLQVTT